MRVNVGDENNLKHYAKKKKRNRNPRHLNPMIEGVEPNKLIAQFGLGFKQDLKTKVSKYGKNQFVWQNIARGQFDTFKTQFFAAAAKTLQVTFSSFTFTLT